MSNWAQKVFEPIEAHNRNIVLQQTWGHLAPKKGIAYKGKIWFAVSAFSSNSVLLINYDFENLESSPWLYDAVLEYINGFELTDCKVYCVDTVFKNFRFKSTVQVLALCE